MKFVLHKLIDNLLISHHFLTLTSSEFIKCSSVFRSFAEANTLVSSAKISSVSLVIDSFEEQKCGPSFRKLNTSLLEDRIRQVSIGYSKKKQEERTTAFKKLEGDLKKAKEHFDQDPTNQNIQNREELKQRYELMYDYITQGAMIRSRVNWHEQGEKNNEYFLNLENFKREGVS